MPSPSATPAPPSVVPSATPPPAVGAAPAGPWSSLAWVDAGPMPIIAPTGSQTFILNVFGWSGGYVAFGSNGGNDGTDNPQPITLMTSSSTDGVHWSAAKSIDLHGFTDSVQIAGVAAAPGAVLALGEYPADTCGGPQTLAGIWRSTDGVAWSRPALSADMQKGGIETLDGGPAGFIATGVHHDGTQAVWLSLDGAAWRGAPLPIVTSGKLVVQDGHSVAGGLVLSGAVVGPEGCGGASAIHPAVWWSADGKQWAREPLPGASSSADVTLWTEKIADDALVAIEGAGDRPKVYWSTADGRTWRKLAVASEDAGFGMIGDGRHAIVANSGDGTGPIMLTEVANDLTTTPMLQSGASPMQAENGPGWNFAVGPTGVLAVASDGSSVRLGVPGG